MSAHEINAWGCVPFEGRCLMHDQELECSHTCMDGGVAEHLLVGCDDPPPPASPVPYHTNCIGCGNWIREGELGRRYEEGYVHANGCDQEASS